MGRVHGLVPQTYMDWLFQSPKGLRAGGAGGTTYLDVFLAYRHYSRSRFGSASISFTHPVKAASAFMRPSSDEEAVDAHPASLRSSLPC
jgi:hypothetical protein